MSHETAISFHAASVPPVFLPIRRFAIALGLLAVCMVAAILLWRLVPHRAAPPPATPAQMRVTVWFRDAEVEDVLRSVAAQADATLAIDPALVGKVSIETRGSTLQDLMTDLCTAFTCKWQLSGGSERILVVRRSGLPPPVLPRLPAS